MADEIKQQTNTVTAPAQMAIKPDQSTLRFLALPIAVRNWLLSDVVTEIIIGLNKKLEAILDETSVIPDAVARLAIAEIKPEAFGDKLRELLPFAEDEVINSAVATIKDRVLKPIAGGLKAIGIDVDRVDSKGAKPFYLEAVPDAPKATVLEFEKAPATQTIKPANTIEGKTAPVGPSATVAQARKPFMLHEESSTPVPVDPKLGQFNEGSIASRPTPRVDNFTFKTPTASRPEENPRPTAVQFGSSFESLSFNRAKQPMNAGMTQAPVAPKVTPTRTASASSPQASPTSNGFGKLTASNPNVPKVIHYTKFRTALPPSEKESEKMIPGKSI